MSILETSYLPQTISSVSSPGTVSAHQSLTVTVTMGGALSSGEKLFVRYSMDSFVTSTLVEITSLNGSFEGTAVIPGAASGTAVQYYALTSNTTPTHSNADYFTLNLMGSGAQNVGANQSYTVVGWTTTADGDWNSAGTWTANAVPSTSLNLGAVAIGHNVTMNQNALVGSINIAADKTLDASSSTLSIADGGTFTNNGTFTRGTSTVHFLFDGAIAGSTATGFYNLTVDGSDDAADYGGVYVPNTATIHNKLTIAQGGYLAVSNGGDGITTSAELPDYASGATLSINGPFTVEGFASGWGSSGAKIPTNVEVGSTGNVTIAIAKQFTGTLIVKGNVFTTGGLLTLKNGAALFVESGSISGNLNYEQEIANTAGWRMMSSPMTATYQDILNEGWLQATTGADYTSSSDNFNVRTYNGSAFVNVTDLTTSPASGQGFIYYHFNDDNYDLTPNASATTFSITGSAASGPVVPTLNSGNNAWTLIGNPYLATIDWDGGNVSTADLTSSVYVYSPAAAGYVSWNGTTGDLTNGLIAPFQGFFVQNDADATSPSVSIPLAAKTTGGTFRGKAATPTQIRLELTGGQLKSSTWIAFTNRGTKEFGSEDALKLVPLDRQYISLFTMASETAVDINELPMISEITEIPLQVNATINGRFSLNLTTNTLPSNWTVSVRDNKSGEVKMLTGDSGYAFDFAAAQKARNPMELSGPATVQSSGEARFTLIVNPGIVTSNEDVKRITTLALEQNYPNPFNPSTAISFSLPAAADVKLSVYDINGRQVDVITSGVKAAGRHTLNWNAAKQASGVYMLRLEAAGQILTRKMTLLK